MASTQGASMSVRTWPRTRYLAWHRMAELLFVSSEKGGVMSAAHQFERQFQG